MSSNYSKGRSLEYTVRKKLQALGYTVFRCAGSRPVDLVAVKQSQILILECKVGKHPSLPSKQLKRLLKISREVNGFLMLALRRRHQKIRWFRITEGGLKELEEFP